MPHRLMGYRRFLGYSKSIIRHSTSTAVVFHKSALVVFLVALQAIGSTGFSQTNKIEVLKKSLNTASTKAETLNAALALCRESHSLNADSLYRYAWLAKKMATELGDAQKKVLANTFIETWLGRKSLFDSALAICNGDLAGLSYTRAGDVYASAMMQKCYLLMKSNRHKEALRYTYLFLGQAEANADTTSQLYGKMIIGYVYRNMEQTDPALDWFLKADHTVTGPEWEEVKNRFGIYFLIGMMYNWKEDADAIQQTRVTDSLQSVFYLDKAISLSRKYENMGILARALGTKADGIEDPKKLSLAGEYIREQVSIYSLMHDTLSILNGLTSMSNYYMSIGMPEKGIEVCKEGIEIVNRGNSFPVMDLYWDLAQCYKAARRNDKYAETLSKIISLKDTLYKKNSARDFADLNSRYEDQKKEKTIIQQKLDIAAKTNAVYGALIITGLLLVAIFLIFRYYYKRQKEQKQQEAMAVTAAEEGERKRIAADLHDNIGSYAAAAASVIPTIRPIDEQSGNTLLFLKDNLQDMIVQLNDSIWALNKKAVFLTAISDRFKVFIQKLGYAYPGIHILLEEQIAYDRSLSSFQALHLFRMMQEALNNSLKHSKCKTVTVVIACTETNMQVTITDDGKGMGDAIKNGNGIYNLTARARESGWQAEWLRNTGGGTSVVISSPVQPATATADQ